MGRTASRDNLNKTESIQVCGSRETAKILRKQATDSDGARSTGAVRCLSCLRALAGLAAGRRRQRLILFSWLCM